MSNFIGLVYATLKNEGVDTTGMTTDEAVEKFKELQRNSGGAGNGEKEPTPAESRKLKEKDIDTMEKTKIQKEVDGWSDDHKYAMLGRLQSDVKYYLGTGGRYNENLWAKDPKEHVEYMEAIYSSLKKKPDWLTATELRDIKEELLNDGKPSKAESEAKKNWSKVNTIKQAVKVDSEIVEKKLASNLLNKYGDLNMSPKEIADKVESLGEVSMPYNKDKVKDFIINNYDKKGKIYASFRELSESIN